MELKVNPTKEAALLSLLEQVAGALPSDIKVTLGERYSPQLTTHELNFSSRDGEFN